MYKFNGEHWIKQDWRKEVSSRIAEAKGERQALDVVIQRLTHVKHLKTVDLDHCDESEIVDSILYILANSSQKGVLEGLIDNTGRKLTFNDIKGTLYVVLRDVIYARGDSKLSLWDCIERISLEKTLVMSSEEDADEFDSDIDTAFAESEDELDDTDERTVDMTPFKDAMMAMRGSLQAIDIVDVTADLQSREVQRRHL